MKSLLDRGGIDAVFFGNSLAAIGVYTCLQEMKVQIPQDIALMTFDDDLWLSMGAPSNFRGCAACRRNRLPCG